MLLCVYPLDVAYIRLAADGSPATLLENQGPTDLLSQLYKSGGVSAFYSGFFLTVLALSVYRGSYYWLYKLYKNTLSKRKEFAGDGAKFLMSTLIAVASALISYPLDTIRKRLIMDEGRPKRHYTGIFDCIAKILEREGISGFFKGGYCVLLREFIGKLILLFV